jgi:glycosyltransferase involved in cell wall biosynthesis
MAGLDHSAGDAAIMMDTDLQHPPELIPLLLDRFEAGYDVVQTVRRYEECIAPDFLDSSFDYHHAAASRASSL